MSVDVFSITLVVVMETWMMVMGMILMMIMMLMMMMMIIRMIAIPLLLVLLLVLAFLVPSGVSSLTIIKNRKKNFEIIKSCKIV